MTAPHPKFRERRAEVEDQTQRSRQRKLLAVVGLIALVLLAWGATQSPLLDVDEVRIVGAERTSTEYLRAVAAVDLGTAVMGLDTGEVEERLRSLPEIATVTAASSWGGVLTIEVTERLPVARIESSDGTAVVAADGLVIQVIDRTPEVVGIDPSVSTEPAETVEPSDDDSAEIAELAPLPADVEALPEIAGAMFSTSRGKQLPDVLDDALRVAAALPDDIASITERIEITVDSLVLKAVGGGEISLGDSRDLEAKFDAVRAFLDQVDLSCLETLNVRAPSVPVIRRTPNC